MHDCKEVKKNAHITVWKLFKNICWKIIFFRRFAGIPDFLTADDMDGNF